MSVFNPRRSPGSARVGSRFALAAIAAALTTAIAVPLATSAPSAASGAAIRHVFVIVMENQGYAKTFGNPTADPYLATTLPSQGALLSNYYGIGHESNDNYIAMVSGQAPNPQNQADCTSFTDFSGSGTVSPGQAVGSGCVFPTSVPNIADQLSKADLSWKGYMQDMGNIDTRESARCGHPALNASDNTQTAVPGDGYATRHNPFVYFHSIIDNATYCRTHVVPLGSPSSTTGFAHDLRSGSTTPTLSFIVPNLCLDGHDYPCKNQTSPSTSDVGDIDTFLRTWVPLITRSGAFQHGLLAIVFDEAAGPPNGDSTACCNEQAGPNSALPGINGMGGGRTGAVLLSPYIKGGTVTATGYNHYSLLASLESLFGLPHLGEAQTVPATFGTDVFSNPH